MNPAEVASALVIEESLSTKGTYRKVDERLYVIKQGSCYVLINIVPWEQERALVKCVAQLVRGVRMDGDLAVQLLHLNSQLRFGAFSYDPTDNLILFSHSILGGATLDKDELVATLTDVALIADEWDDRIIQKYGGQTMREVLEEAALDRLLDADPEGFLFGGAKA